MPHNVDFHAVTGQGGGAANTTVAPGGTATIEARLLYPGMFMYHCAMGDVPEHISRGMFGGILVDPAEPLPAVDHEWYIVQSEYYTTSTEPGLVETDRAAITAEQPTMVVFNGAKGTLTGENAPRMQVGERARIYFINAGLNLIPASIRSDRTGMSSIPRQRCSMSRCAGRRRRSCPPAAAPWSSSSARCRAPSSSSTTRWRGRSTRGHWARSMVEGEPNPEIFEPIAIE